MSLRYPAWLVPLLLGSLALPARPGWTQEPGQRPGPRATLRPFGSDAELASYMREVREEYERRLRRQREEAERRAKAAERCKPPAPKVRTTRLAPPAPGSAVIRGRVTDTSGRPLLGSRVLIPELRIVSTADSGGYRLTIPPESLTVLPSRRVTIRAQMIGYQAVQHTLTVRPRDSVDLDFTLCVSEIRLRALTAVSALAVAGVAGAEERITNAQHEGVDEGGIVKLHGDYLVILRRGRLFTVAVGGRKGGRDLAPVAAVDAFSPDIDPQHAWYDELLISEDKVVVIGYSYERGGTEIGVFRIDGRGNLTYLATYQLRSNDYYSSRNYASRLIGTKLVFYAPLYLWYGDGDLFAAFPAIRRWSRGAGDRAFKRIIPAQRVYRTPQPVAGFDIALHTVTICDLAAVDPACEASAILGPGSRVFYVSPQAVYVWVSSWSYPWVEGRTAMLYRMPLDGSAPSALRVSGSPVDQFSFLESNDGHVNVLVRSEGRGDAMWQPEWSAGEVAVLRVPLESFGDGTGEAPWWRYRRLPGPAGYTFHNRFVGDHVLYGLGSGWGEPRKGGARLYVVGWRNGAVTEIDLPHGVDRIEALGADAVIVGAEGEDLHFTGIRLGGTPEPAQRYTMAGAAQGELRSHGFFYRAEGPDSGVLGLPVRQPEGPGYRHLFEGSAGVVFLQNAARRFQPLGVLRARDDGGKPQNDGCRASCVDWYGNARPLFFRGRIVALLGYELVEGAIAGGEISEMRRESFAPGVVRAVSR